MRFKYNANYNGVIFKNFFIKGNIFHLSHFFLQARATLVKHVIEKKRKNIERFCLKGKENWVKKEIIHVDV